MRPYSPPGTNALPFVKPVPLPDLSRVTLPAMTLASSEDAAKVVAVRYNPADGSRHRYTATAGAPNVAGNDWMEVKGSFLEAVKAAQYLAGWKDDEWYQKNEPTAHTSAVVLQVADGVYHISRNQFPDGMGDGMDALISMPIDHTNATDSEVSFPYPDAWGEAGASVRFNDPRAVAVVGVDSYAQPRAAT